ncbi:MAG: hypothetical protein J4O06_00205 [Chloroflexi bacterium]|nr:hypothetical protein [Chloroflexota bacterium]
MAFPWNRSDAAAQATPAEGRRRARGRRLRQEVDRRESSRASRERRHQRTAITIGVGLLLLIFGIVSFGFYQEFYRPPRVWAGSVRDVEFTMGELVQRIRVLQGLSGQVDLSIVPFEYLRNLLDAEVLRQAGAGLGISVTEGDVDQAAKDQFLPQKPEGQESDPGQLEQEYRNNLQIFLARTNLTEAEYRVILREQLALRRLALLLGLGIDDTQEQVEVEWIRLELNSRVDAAEVRNRLDNEDFARVAGEVNTAARYAQPGGYVGWVPKGAFPSLDATLFGDEEKNQEALELGEFSRPIFTQDGVYIIHKISGLTEQDISDVMRFKLNTELVRKWQDDQQLAGSNEGWLRMNFNSKLYAWVADQVRLSAPRTGPRAPGQPGPGLPGPGGLPGR